MAKPKRIKGRRIPLKSKREVESPYTRRNIKLMLGGMGIGIVGLLLLLTGDTVISTILIVLGYVVIIPLALILDLGRKKITKEKE